jgi:tRNA pseudouridine38-40 synthase
MPHARGQVASFRADLALPIAALRPVLNAQLPEDVRVRDAAEVADEFDARRSATARRYSYRLLDREDVLLRRIAWHPRIAVDPDRLVRAMRPLEGDHDCAAFQATGSSKTVTRCRILRAQWRRWESGSLLDVIANHFLYHMVRNLVGTALAVADRADPAGAMAAILASRDRRRAGRPRHRGSLSRRSVLSGGTRMTRRIVSVPARYRRRGARRVGVRAFRPECRPARRSRHRAQRRPISATPAVPRS